MKSVRRILGTLLALGVISAGITVQAQYREYRGNFRTVRVLIHRIEARTGTFRTSVDASRNLGELNNTGKEDRLDLLVTDFEAALTTLREQFDQRASTRSDAQEVLNRAARIDAFARRNSFDWRVRRDWSALRSDLNQLAQTYNISWPTTGSYPPDNTYPPANTYPPTSPPAGYPAAQLTGTYRLDPSRSDDPREAADRATASLPNVDRQRVRDQLAARLASPEQIAIELRGRTVTLASSRAPQITFEADGLERLETTSNGRSIRARAVLNGDQLTVSSTGDRYNDFNVTFDPIDNGRRLSVLRRVYSASLSRPVMVQSTYDRTSDVARFEIYNAPDTYPTTGSASSDFLIPNGEVVSAVLNEALSTKTARDGDRFTATVRQPSQYEGATIEGHVSNVQRSGRITGRSEMTLNFDTIRLRDGRSYRFAGLVEQVRTPEGETVKVDTEGAVREESQTTKTAQRAAIGTAVGAIIGAIAGGGKGAAIGAIIGAGGGAGSVYVQGRDDLDLGSGTEMTIRASGPR